MIGGKYMKLCNHVSQLDFSPLEPISTMNNFDCYFLEYMTIKMHYNIGFIV
jgi:hypothetical protein